MKMLTIFHWKTEEERKVFPRVSGGSMSVLYMNICYEYITR